MCPPGGTVGDSHTSHACNMDKRRERYDLWLVSLASVSVICPSGKQQRKKKRNKNTKGGPAIVVSALLGVTADVQRLSLALGGRVARGRDHGDIGGGGVEERHHRANTTRSTTTTDVQLRRQIPLGLVFTLSVRPSRFDEPLTRWASKPEDRRMQIAVLKTQIAVFCVPVLPQARVVCPSLPPRTTPATTTETTTTTTRGNSNTLVLVTCQLP